MAQDQVEAMAALGFDSFAVVGHDRGGRVAHRMALDHPERVTPAGRARHRAHARGLRERVAGPGHLLLPLVLPDPALRLPGAADRRRPGLLPRAQARAAGARAIRSSPPRRWPSTGAASATRPPSTPAARTTARRPRSTSSTTRRISIAGSPARCWRSGATRAGSPSSSTSPRPGATAHPTCSGRALRVRAFPRRGGTAGDRRRAAGLPPRGWNRSGPGRARPLAPYLMKRISAYFGSGQRSSATSFSSASPSSRTRSSAVSWLSRA